MHDESWPDADRQDGDPRDYMDVFTAFWPGFIVRQAPWSGAAQKVEDQSLIGITTYRVCVIPGA